MNKKNTPDRQQKTSDKKNNQKIHLKNEGRNLRYLKTFIPAGAAAALVITALGSYQAPVFKAKTPASAASTTAKAAITGQTSDKKKKLPTVKTLKNAGKNKKSAAPSTGASRSVGTVDDSDTTYKDGTYTGSAQGFGGPIRVSVTIKGGRISSVRVLSHSGETPAYYNKASVLTSEIAQKNTTNVDTVSGATYSSNGIIKAVRNALAKAAGKKVSDDTSASSSSSAGTAAGTGKQTAGKSGPKKVKKVNDKNARYKDGTYTGSAQGFGGPIKVSVTIKSGRISSVRVLSHSGETPAYYNKASVLTSEITQKNTTNVDTVSGATYSSNGIIEAVRDALSKAQTSAGKSASEKKNTSNTKKKVSDNKKNSKDNNSGKKNENNNSSKDSNSQKPSDPSEENKDNNNTTDPSSDEPSVPAARGKYKDGTYPVKTTVYCDDDYSFDDYELTMNVTIKNDLITKISDIVNTDGDQTNLSFIRWAANGRRLGKTTYTGVVKQITSSGNTSKIDTVSGATCSSKAIIAGANEALKQAASN